MLQDGGASTTPLVVIEIGAPAGGAVEAGAPAPEVRGGSARQRPARVSKRPLPALGPSNS
jgi:hypothetical protein